MIRATVLTTVLLLAGCASTPAPSAPAPEVSLAFELPDLDGAPTRLEDYLGQVVFVDVWASWCAPCEASFPFYADLHERLGPRGLVILAVSVDQDEEDLEAFLDRHPVPFRVLRDPGGTVPAQIGLETMPTAVVVDREGRVAGVHQGFRSGDEPGIEAAIRAALDRGKGVDPPAEPGGAR